MRSRFYIAMTAFVVLATLAWLTLTEEKLRLATMAVLGMFALRTFFYYRSTVRSAMVRSAEDETRQ